MRITIPVSGDGDAWLAHLPEVNFDPAEMLDGGKLVMPKVVDLFKRANDFSEANGFRQTFTSSSDDGFNVYSMTIEFLRQLSAVTKWLESRSESKAHVSSNNSPQDRRLERRMSRDQVAFCRIDVTNVAGGVRILIGYANPKQKVIGNCASGAKECAVYLARIALNMAETINALDRSRTVAHNAVISGVKILNRMAKQADLPPVYDGIVSEARPYRREVANAVFAYIEDVIRNRTPKEPEEDKEKKEEA